jgi:hypothetical protein
MHLFRTGERGTDPACRAGFDAAVIRSLSACKEGTAFSSGFICTSNRNSFYNIEKSGRELRIEDPALYPE